MFLERNCKDIKMTFHDYHLGYLNNNTINKYRKGNMEDDKLFFKRTKSLNFKQNLFLGAISMPSIM